MEKRDWVETKHKDLSKSSRTSALWSSYVRYVNIVQDFIRAERTNDWNLNILSNNAILNLFAATGNNNYAKSTRLYLQSLAELERNNQKFTINF